VEVPSSSDFKEIEMFSLGIEFCSSFFISSGIGESLFSRFGLGFIPLIINSFK